VVAYIFKEYAAAKNLIIITKIAVIDDVYKIGAISMISLKRLIDGGAAIFQAVNKNHHIDRVGKIVIIPFVKNILRV
jgi:hypothetical protein